MEGRSALCLVGHGMPPSDFPREKLMALERLEHKPDRSEEEGTHHARLEEELRRWPRTPANDPYWRGLADIADRVRARAGYDLVAVAFNEFCAPTLAETLEDLAAKGATSIVVVPTMMVRGGVHSERDIAAEVEAAQRRHDGLRIRYAWPFETDDVADFLRRQADRFA